jgi:hypothetical protein
LLHIFLMVSSVTAVVSRTSMALSSWCARASAVSLVSCCEAVRGLIIGEQVDDKLKYAIKAAPGLVALQVFEFKGKENWIPIATAQ